MEYKVGSTVFHDWIITREIGEGGTGKVFEIEKRDFGTSITSALKVVRIPRSVSDINAVMSEGMDKESVREYFYGFVEEILQEIKTMVSLKGHSNIVAYEDHCVIAHEDGIGWDILIKMELLIPLSKWLISRQLSESEVIRLGCEISGALSYTAKHGLMHRDVKPGNIFVDKFGKFKLGDFGIARTIEKTTIAYSKKGTESYMAPEIYLNEKYNAQVDIYSLGIVLYRLLNENRLPFYPPTSEKITHKDREEAITKRIRGQKLPEPVNGSPELKRIIMKACEYAPEKRYAVIEDMHRDLQRLQQMDEKNMPQKPAENKKSMLPIVISVTAALAGCALLVMAFMQKKEEKEIVMTVPETVQESSESILDTDAEKGILESITEMETGSKKTESVVETEARQTEESETEAVTDGESETEAVTEGGQKETIAEGKWYYITSDYKDGIAVRSEPTGESKKLTRVPKGTEFYVEKYSDNWGYTTVNGVTGWIELDYAGLMEYEADAWYRIVSNYKKGIAVRNEPTGESRELARLPYGTEFYVEKTENNWGYAMVNGVTGWIALDYAEVVQNEAAADTNNDELKTTDTIVQPDEVSEEMSITGYREYDDILRRYHEGAEAGWSIQAFSEQGLCYLAGYEPDLTEMGYCLLDIDQDETDELIIGRNYEGYEGMVFEIYTILDGKAVCIASSGERSRYYICQDGTIANEGSSSATRSSWRYYDMTGGQLELKEAVFADGDYDRSNPWFYTTANLYEDYSNPISEEEAYAIIGKYEYITVPFISLASLQN